MFCKYCGKEVEEQAVICLNCGGLLDETLKMKDEVVEKNGMAVAGFVCSFFLSVLGWVFGGIGLARSFKRKGKGKGLSIAALAIASANALLSIIASI